MKEKMKMEFEPSDLVKLKPEIALWSHVKHDWAYSAKGALFLVLATAPPHRVYLLTPNGLIIPVFSDLIVLAERNPIL
jgi:hypothetical protein